MLLLEHSCVFHRNIKPKNMYFRAGSMDIVVGDIASTVEIQSKS